jgi:membrane protein implicated in regulation of membrane protease activity
MSMGASRAEAHQPDDGIGVDQGDWAAIPLSGAQAPQIAWSRPEPDEPGPESERKLLGPILIAAAILWTALATWVAMAGAAAGALPNLMQWFALMSAPIAVLGLAWLLFGGTSRRDADRFTRSVAEMRRESQELEGLLAAVTARLDENHGKITAEAGKLMALGDEASDRLGRVAHYLSKESAKLDAKSDALEKAAEKARNELGVLMSDLPKAEAQALQVAERMKEAGLTAHGQAGALEGQLSALIARGREADEVVGGAAQRLGAHLSRVESTTGAATTRMQEAAAAMAETVDGTMARAAEAVDAARIGLEAQGAAMMAMIEQSRAALDRAGEDATRNLGQRLESIGGKIEAFAAHLAAQDAASQALVTSLGKDLRDLDERFLALRETGSGTSDSLGGAIETVRASMRQLSDEIGGSNERATALIARAREMAGAMGSVTEQLTADVPAALGRIEEQAERALTAVSSIAPNVEAVASSADAAASRLAETEAALSRQQEALEAMLARLQQGVGTAEEQIRGLSAAVTEADEATGKIVSDTGPELIESLVRVREAAGQAAERAREAIAAVIPQSAAALGEASREAIGQAIGDEVGQQMEQLSALAERTVEAARKASERLTRQMLTIGETTAAVEERIDESRKEREARDSENFSRRVALLIESLNSTAIDVTKILSNEVTDSAWAAYMKGDRGVFTRRAVRLLDTNEAREIMQHYEAEPEFRDQVNRYIHDFESMLRRILADRDSSALGVTILSSDMGKLYVALAQAIERIRA